MMTTELSAIQRNSVESERLAAAIAEFERKDGKIQQVGVFKPEPPPKRRDWIDPATVLNRKPPAMSRRERNTLRKMAAEL
ncbi:hypothetical protein [Pseudomonas coronafaciens]|uniref:hypothetical protein n=1 Tax=Pseudomonas coronafaciens TaxID=53409 RepID=UPI000EFFB31E|nr:hypothetical protein [Pseudomonas coronafaciens]RMP29858.1 hypothetical protein ALQ25_03701 [Pseudomonas coronafaciens pv. atropurpurea]